MSFYTNVPPAPLERMDCTPRTQAHLFRVVPEYHHKLLRSLRRDAAKYGRWRADFECNLPAYGPRVYLSVDYRAKECHVHVIAPDAATVAAIVSSLTD